MIHICPELQFSLKIGERMNISELELSDELYLFPNITEKSISLSLLTKRPIMCDVDVPLYQINFLARCGVI